MIAERYFDQYPRFYETSRTGESRVRNNIRYQMLIEAHCGILEGARVVDIASHDGRWCFAALRAGARHVTGIEPQAELIESARANFQAYDVPKEAFTFIRSDALSALESHDLAADVVFGFGFLSLIADQARLFGLIRRLGASHIILDTPVDPDPGPILRLHRYRAVDVVNGVPISCDSDATHYDEFNVGARPSPAALSLMMDHYGYDLHATDCTRYLVDHEEVEDYCAQRRAVFVATLRT